MRTHVKRTVSRCFASLRRLRQIRHSVPTATLQMLEVALVHSRLDYGNSVLVGLPAYLLPPVGPERSRPSGVSSESSRPHHRRTYQSSLVASPRTDTVQDGCSDIQSPAWRRTTLPQFASACRWRAWSTSTPLCRIEPPADSAVHTVNRRFRSQQHSSGTGFLTMSRRPIRCRLFSSSWNTLCSSSHSQTSSCNLFLNCDPSSGIAT